MNEQTPSSTEGSPAVEQAEQRILGQENYQKAEVLHRFADAHPWVHPTLIAVGILLVVGIAWLILSRK